jgi:hypothetical protein
MIPKFSPLVAAISVALVAATANAQMGGVGGMGGIGGRRGGLSDRNRLDQNNSVQGERPAADGLTYEIVEYRLTLLEESLKLTSTQKAEWQTFAKNVSTYAADVARERARIAASTSISASGSSQAGTLYVRQVVDAARNRLTALEDIETAAKALYLTLTTEQKVIADMRIPTFIAPRVIGPTTRP